MKEYSDVEDQVECNNGPTFPETTETEHKGETMHKSSDAKTITTTQDEQVGGYTDNHNKTPTGMDQFCYDANKYERLCKRQKRLARQLSYDYKGVPALWNSK